VVLFAALTVCASAASTIHVPADLPTIQGGIDAAVDGDIVLVAAGVYLEHINFHGKAITVTSEQGPGLTVIDGNSADSVVTFTSGEGRASILAGFTLLHGSSGFDTPGFGNGGGIRSNASPAIQDNVITNNQACAGVGISVNTGAPLIQRNIIRNNFQTGCSGGLGGGGISLLAAGAAEIVNNIIENNTMTSANGGGISLLGGNPIIRGNIVRQNTAAGLGACTQGGGLWIVNQDAALVVNNLITGNNADCGGGVYSGGLGPVLINNTIAANNGLNGSGIYGEGGLAQLINNIVVAPSGQYAVFCPGGAPFVFKSNDVYGNSGLTYGGLCGNQTGLNGNIAADPSFVDPFSGDFHVTPGSPIIDMGTNENAPTVDIDGNPRPADGNNDGTAAIDIGAYEIPKEYLTAPDLTATKINSTGGTAHFPSPWTWSITVANHGGFPATFAKNQTILRDNLPLSGIAYGAPNLSTVRSVTGSGVITCTISLGDLSCLATGGSVAIAPAGIFIVSFSAAPTTGGTFVNPRNGGVCLVDPDGVLGEADETNNNCSDLVLSIGADMQITKVIAAGVSGGSATAGSNVTYLITATNNGPDTAANVVVTDVLPANTTFVSCTASVGTCNFGTKLSANLGSMANGAQATVTVVVNVNYGVPQGTVISNTANVVSSSLDVNPGNNNGGPVAFTVLPPPPADLQLTKIISAGVSGGFAAAGSNVTHLITVTNSGPNAAANVVVTDNLPANATFVACAASTGTCGYDSHVGKPVASIGSLANGAQVTVAIVANVGCSVANGTMISNTASVSSPVPDPNLANNSAGPVTFTVGPPTPIVDVSVSQNVFTQNNHDLVNVGLAATATYASCPSATSFTVQVYGDENDETPTAKNEVYSPDAKDMALGTLRLRAERVDNGDGRVYLIVVTANSALGGTGFGTATVVVPKSSGASSLASALSQGAAVRALANANSGSPPSGYFVIGDGPIIGPKQ
jgi:uncharacterized repeat protein (TIGR01451 family)